MSTSLSGMTRHTREPSREQEMSSGRNVLGESSRETEQSKTITGGLVSWVPRKMD